MESYKYFEGRAKFGSGVHRIENSFEKLTYSGCFEAPFVLSTPFFFEVGGLRKAVRIAKLLITFHSADDSNKGLIESADGHFGLFIEDVEVSEEDQKVIDFSYQANLRIDLPSSYETKMFQAIGDGLSMDFFGSISTDNVVEKLESNEEFKNYKLKLSSLKIYVGSCPVVSWYSSGIKQQVNELLKDCYVQPYSQVKRIVEEFADSASKSDVFLFDKSNESVTQVKELLEEARVAFKEPTPDPEDLESSYSNLWRKTPSEIKAFAKKKEKSEGEKLLRDYDELWPKQNLGSILSSRSLKIYSKHDIRPPLVEELENVAFALLNLKPLWSPLLSRLLISALLFAETEAFARSLDSTKFSASTEPVKASGNTFLELIQKVVKAAFNDVGRLALEAVYIAITYLVASALANNNEVAVWTITTGFTLWRWGRNLFSHVHMNKHKNFSDLLSQMIAVHTMADRSFNSKLLRAELYRITALGAVFSPWVFNLLDRQIEFEDSQCE